MTKVRIINYGMGNLDSVARAVERCGAEPIITDRPQDCQAASALILPGVGSFADGMSQLHKRGFLDVLPHLVLEKRVPFLGICLGMQLLAEKGEEGGATSGLGWISGCVTRLQTTNPSEKLPHVGWNEVFPTPGSAAFDGIEPGKDFYFVHSYHFQPSNPQSILARTPYCGGFVSAVGRDNIVGVQFHPEKSQKIGFQFLKNFLTQKAVAC